MPDAGDHEPRKLHVTVTDDDGETVYTTWNADQGWKSATLFFGQTATDINGDEIGLSYWDLITRTPRELADQIRARADTPSTAAAYWSGDHNCWYVPVTDEVWNMAEDGQLEPIELRASSSATGSSG